MSTPRNGGGGNKLGQGTPRNRGSALYTLTPRNCSVFGRVKTPQQLATAAAALHVRRKSIQRYGASLLRTPKDVPTVPRIIKALKRLAESRWDSPRKRNQFRNAMKISPAVSAWNERRYQQANEVNNRRRPFRRNQNTHVRKNDGYRGGQVNPYDQENSRFAMTSPIPSSTKYLRNPLNKISNATNFLPVFSGTSSDDNPSSTSSLPPRNSNEQTISAFGMNMYVPPLIEQKGKLRPIVIDGSNVAMG